MRNLRKLIVFCLVMILVGVSPLVGVVKASSEQEQRDEVEYYNEYNYGMEEDKHKDAEVSEEIEEDEMEEIEEDEMEEVEEDEIGEIEEDEIEGIEEMEDDEDIDENGKQNIDKQIEVLEELLEKANKESKFGLTAALKAQLERLKAEKAMGEEFKEGSEDEEIEEMIEEIEEMEETGEGLNINRGWETAKFVLENIEDEIEETKDQLENQIDDLEEQYEEAKEKGNFELAEKLLLQIQEIKVEKESLKVQMKQLKEKMIEVVKNMYTEEEMNKLNKIAEELMLHNPNLKVLPVERIFLRGTNIKFDTPPVIQEGRTLVPVRAISEAFGAEVSWDPENKKVAIIKDGKEIILQISSTKVYVDGVEYEIDVPASIINSRTLVPLRFVIEALGLEVKWDGETETIEIINN